jgi:hypothetical protein
VLPPGAVVSSGGIGAGCCGAKGAAAKGAAATAAGFTAAAGGIGAAAAGGIGAVDAALGSASAASGNGPVGGRGAATVGTAARGRTIFDTISVGVTVSSITGGLGAARPPSGGKIVGFGLGRGDSPALLGPPANSSGAALPSLSASSAPGAVPPKLTLFAGARPAFWSDKVSLAPH